MPAAGAAMRKSTVAALHVQLASCKGGWIRGSPCAGSMHTYATRSGWSPAMLAFGQLPTAVEWAPCMIACALDANCWLQMRFVPLQGPVRRCSALAVAGSGKYVAVAEELMPTSEVPGSSASQGPGAQPEPAQYQAGVCALSQY